MNDARDFRLPDLPNAGYATLREKQLTDAVMQFMREIERDRARLLTIVIEGKAKWRMCAVEVWGALRVDQDHQLLDSIYDYFTLQAARPGVQRMLLNARHNPPKWREIVTALIPHLEREREALKLYRKWSA